MWARGTTIPEGRSTARRPMSFAKDTVFAVRCETGYRTTCWLASLKSRREAGTETTRSGMEYGMGDGERLDL